MSQSVRRIIFWMIIGTLMFIFFFVFVIAIHAAGNGMSITNSVFPDVHPHSLSLMEITERRKQIRTLSDAVIQESLIRYLTPFEKNTCYTNTKICKYTDDFFKNDFTSSLSVFRLNFIFAFIPTAVTIAVLRWFIRELSEIRTKTIGEL